MRLPRPFRRGGGEPAPDDALTRAVELRAFLAAGDPNAWGALANLDPELVKPLHNMASHPSSGLDVAEVRARVAGEAAALWDALDQYWSRVAAWVAAGGASAKSLTPAQVYAIDEGPLYGPIRGNYRTMSDGTVVGLADVVRYMAATGDEFRF
jgi:hypothetical protein